MQILFYLRYVVSSFIRAFFTFIACLSAVYASCQPQWLLHRPYADGYRFIDSLKRWGVKVNQPAYAKLEQWANDQGDKELAMLFKVKRYEDSIDKGITLQQLNELQNEARDFPLISIDLIQLIGNYYLDGEHKNSWALEYYIKAYNAYKDIPADKFPPKRKYLYSLAGSYYRYRDYVNAIQYYKKAVEAKGLPEDLRTINNTIGMCYQQLKKYDSAELYLLQTYNTAVKNNDSEWILIVGQNLGATYYYEKKYTQAIPLLEAGMYSTVYVNSMSINFMAAVETLAEIYYKQQRTDIAEKYLLYAQHIYNSINKPRESFPAYGEAEKIYRLLHKIYAAKNDMRLASMYADSAIDAADSTRVREMSLNLTSATERAEFANHKLAMAELQHEQSQASTMRNSLGLAIILITIIGILLINRQRLKQNKTQAEKKNAETELKTAVSQLDTFRNTVHEKNELIEQFTNELDKIKKGQEEQADNELISRLERSIILTDEQWEEFKILFEKVHKGFFASLKKKMPDLTQSEIRLMALTKLKLTPKEMAAMLGISVNSIRTYRHRLRKKLDVDSDELMEELLGEI